MEIYYRGEPRKYKNIRPALTREEIGRVPLAAESRYYRDSVENLEEILHIARPRDYGGDERDCVKALATLQHYGFRTRLIDVTRNKGVARYFACASHFDEDGYIHVIKEDAGFIPVQSEWAYSVKRKIHLLFTGVEFIESGADLSAYFARRDKIPAGYIQHWTISDPVILDYEKVFGTQEAINIRYQRQEAGFILLGNKIERKRGRLVLRDEINHGALDRLEKVVVRSEEKLPALYELSRRTPAINFVRLFPDATRSIELSRMYRDVYFLVSSPEKSAELFGGYLEREFSGAGGRRFFESTLLPRVPAIYQKLAEEDLFYFVFGELAGYCRYYQDLSADDAFVRATRVIDGICAGS